MDVEEFIRPHLSQIKTVLKTGSGQFMVVGMDKTVLEEIVRHFPGLTRYEVVPVENQRDLEPERKLFVLELENNSSIGYQSLLYYYLELPSAHKCFVCLISTSSLALEFFEKRVRSRFKNRIFFVPCLTAEDKYEISSSIAARSQKAIMEKYGLPRFSSEMIFDLLEPLHFALLGIAFHHTLNIQKCYEQFKMAVLNTPELKKTPSTRVLFGVFDLLDSGLINSVGQPCVDYGEFKAFVAGHCPLYIKKLIGGQDGKRDMR